ncbi:MAG: Crp/Fnr family transcriptional regulator [Erythrobacter sp.]|nr:Crp/Fnr family transcriptional regulator [Erythrobacter sp.]
MSRFQELVVEHGREKALDPGEHVFSQGDSDSNVYFVKTGLLKAYYIRADGKEHIKSFLPEGSIIGSMVALVDGDACTFSLQALEDGVVVALPYAKLELAAQNDVDLANALIAFLSTYGKRKERREYELLSLSPEDRFAILLETMPDIADRVSQADMAAYVGVTPQALSRIKRRMAK